MKFVSASTLLFISVASVGQPLVTNNGLTLTNQANLTITVQGGYTNQTSGTPGVINNSGIITLTGNWLNNSANTVFSTNSGTVQMIGNAAQTIGGTNSTGFYNLTLNSTFGTNPQFSLGVNTVVKNNLALTNGFVNLASNTLTVGLSAASPGAISHSQAAGNGWLYGGSLIRYFNNVTIPNRNIAGLFPMGDNGTHFRPIYVSAPSVAPTVGGTITVSHTASTTTSSVNFAVEGDVAKFRQDSFWAMSAGGGLSGGTYNLSAEGTGFGTIANVNDMRITLSSSAVGTSAANAGTTTNPQVNVTGLGYSELTNSFYMTSVDAASPLPVELLYFRAIPSGHAVTLVWATASETNNSHYTIERSVDGTLFEPIATIDGAGFSREVLNYTYTDGGLPAGVVYYRLIQTDFDGTAEVFEVIRAESALAIDDVAIFPNPVSGTLYFSGVPQASVIHLVNVQGKVLLSVLPGEGRREMNVSSLSPGVYFVSVDTGGASVVHKVIVAY